MKLQPPIKSGQLLFSPDDSPEITAQLRVVSQSIKPFTYPQVKEGEVIEVKAVGVWGDYEWPVSLHITVPPGCGVIPATGDQLEVTIKRY